MGYALNLKIDLKPLNWRAVRDSLDTVSDHYMVKHGARGWVEVFFCGQRIETLCDCTADRAKDAAEAHRMAMITALIDGRVDEFKSMLIEPFYGEDGATV